MHRAVKLILVPLVLAAMFFVATPRDAEASRWRRGYGGWGWGRPYVGHYHAYRPYRAYSYRVYRPYGVYYHAPVWRSPAYRYHYGW